MATKRPSPDSASAPHAYFASRNGLVSSTATRASQRSSGNSATGATCWKPALATTVSSPPRLSSAASTAARFPSRVVRSAANGSPGPSASGSRSTASTRAPPATSRSAIARPIPLAAPVTRALRPSTAGLLAIAARPVCWGYRELRWLALRTRHDAGDLQHVAAERHRVEVAGGEGAAPDPDRHVARAAGELRQPADQQAKSRRRAGGDLPDLPGAVGGEVEVVARVARHPIQPGGEVGRVGRRDVRRHPVGVQQVDALDGRRAERLVDVQPPPGGVDRVA